MPRESVPAKANTFSQIMCLQMQSQTHVCPRAFIVTRRQMTVSLLRTLPANRGAQRRTAFATGPPAAVRAKAAGLTDLDRGAGAGAGLPLSEESSPLLPASSSALLTSSSSSSSSSEELLAGMGAPSGSSPSDSSDEDDSTAAATGAAGCRRSHHATTRTSRRSALAKRRRRRWQAQKAGALTGQRCEAGSEGAR